MPKKVIRLAAVAAVVLAAAVVFLVRSEGPAVQILGRWFPVEVDAAPLPDGTDASDYPVVFLPDGSWRAWDGCQQNGGRYRLEGVDLSASGNTVGVGCSGFQPNWDLLVGSSTRVDREGSQIVFRTKSGHVNLRLRAADDARGADIADDADHVRVPVTGRVLRLGEGTPRPTFPVADATVTFSGPSTVSVLAGRGGAFRTALTQGTYSISVSSPAMDRRGLRCIADNRFVIAWWYPPRAVSPVCVSRR